MEDQGIFSMEDLSTSPTFSPPKAQFSYPKSKIKILLLEGVAESGADILRKEGYNVRSAQQH